MLKDTKIITDDDRIQPLTPEIVAGRRVMQEIGNYSHWGLATEFQRGQYNLRKQPGESNE